MLLQQRQHRLLYTSVPAMYLKGQSAEKHRHPCLPPLHGKMNIIAFYLKCIQYRDQHAMTGLTELSTKTGIREKLLA